ncbi:MAG: helix-turn-helix domain-containing protein [Planctomycetaceae bacterium]
MSRAQTEAINAAVPCQADAPTNIAQGRAAARLPVNAELSIQQAAEVLNVSPPFVSRLVESGALPSRKLGTRRSVALRDLLAFKQRDDHDRQRAADQLAADAQDLRMGY